MLMRHLLPDELPLKQALLHLWLCQEPGDLVEFAQALGSIIPFLPLNRYEMRRIKAFYLYRIMRLHAKPPKSDSKNNNV